MQASKLWKVAGQIGLSKELRATELLWLIKKSLEEGAGLRDLKRLVRNQGGNRKEKLWPSNRWSLVRIWLLSRLILLRKRQLKNPHTYFINSNKIREQKPNKKNPRLTINRNLLCRQTIKNPTNMILLPSKEPKFTYNLRVNTKLLQRISTQVL